MLYNYNTVQYGTDYRHCDKLHSAQHLWQKHEMNILKVAICHDASVRQYCILVVLYSIQAELERDSHGIGYNVAGARVGLAWLQMFPMMFYRDSEVQAFKASESLDPGRARLSSLTVTLESDSLRPGVGVKVVWIVHQLHHHYDRMTVRSKLWTVRKKEGSCFLLLSICARGQSRASK